MSKSIEELFTQQTVSATAEPERSFFRAANSNVEEVQQTPLPFDANAKAEVDFFNFGEFGGDVPQPQPQAHVLSRLEDLGGWSELLLDVADDERSPSRTQFAIHLTRLSSVR